MTNFIPEKDPLFYSDIPEYSIASLIIKSRKFYPTWISGPKGCGKTSTIKQICAEQGREFFRVNFNQETDESELFGSIELVEKNGATESKFSKGPVIEAMERGAILLLDEVDVAHPNKILCLQSVLEGQPAFIKSQNLSIKPADGFTIFATSNTKGKGCDSGDYIGTNIMNSAFLDRFHATIEQTYPTRVQELKLLQFYYSKYVWIDAGLSDKDITPEEKEFAKTFIKRLCLWAEQVRLTNQKEEIEDTISTRSLISIVKSYSIFKDEVLAIQLCCARYSEASKLALLEIYKQKFDVRTDTTTSNSTYVDADLGI